MRWIIRLKQPLELCHAGSVRFLDDRLALAAAIHAIGYLPMQMDVEIGRGTEALDERDRTAVSLAALQSRLFDQKCGNDAVESAAW
jgi:hypothetical protein